MLAVRPQTLAVWRLRKTVKLPWIKTGARMSNSSSRQTPYPSSSPHDDPRLKSPADEAALQRTVVSQ
jgi:hypothetical protein